MSLFGITGSVIILVTSFSVTVASAAMEIFTGLFIPPESDDAHSHHTFQTVL